MNGLASRRASPQLDCPDLATDLRSSVTCSPISRSSCIWIMLVSLGTAGPPGHPGTTHTHPPLPYRTERSGGETRPGEAMGPRCGQIRALALWSGTKSGHHPRLHRGGDRSREPRVRRLREINCLGSPALGPHRERRQLVPSPVPAILPSSNVFFSTEREVAPAMGGKIDCYVDVGE